MAAHSGAARAFTIPGAVAWLREVLSSHASVHAWASAHPDAHAMVGRGRVFSVPAPCPGPDLRSRWVVRHFRRGGAVAGLLGDRYLAVGTPRPEREARASVEARARGIPTPAVVAGVVYPAWPYYRADLVTEQLPGAADLAEVLFYPSDGRVPREEALVAAGRLVRALERAGVFHPDLNAKNVLITAEGDDVTAHLVDLDRCHVRPRGITAPAYPMRRRLARSLRKFEARTIRHLTAAEWGALARGWEQKPSRARGGPE